MFPNSCLKSVQNNLASRVKSIDGKITMARRGIIWETPEVTISFENDQQKNGENGESFTRIETYGDDMDNSNQV
ncbi:hypothetical protein Tco_1347587, partial [Tanacetum coccineum]